MPERRLVYAVLVALYFSSCTALICKGRYLNRTTAVRCLSECGDKEKCLCVGDSTPSKIIGLDCNQRCEHQVPDDKTIDKCPDMECSKFDTCYQICRGDVECSKMRCSASRICRQECGHSKCPHIVCSARICNQDCANCTMECTSEVEECQQYCNGGVCKSICHARECSRSCKGAPGESCEIKIVSQSVKVSVLSLVNLILVSLFLVAPAI